MKDIDKDSPFIFAGKYGPLLRPFIKRIFSPINLPELYKESITSLAGQGHIVFAHGSKSTIDALLLNFRLKRDGLPYPDLIFGRSFPLLQPATKAFRRLLGKLAGSSPFDHGFYRTFMEGKHNASLIFLDSEPSKRWPDPILELLKVQRETDMPIFLVPQRIVYQRAPLKLKDSSDEEQMRVTGFRKFITLFRGQEHGFVEHGEPINLLDELKRAQTGRKFFEEIAVEIRGRTTPQAGSAGQQYLRRTHQRPVLPYREDHA